MLEIVAIYFFARRIGEIVELKGYRSGWYKVFAALSWLGGEITGAILAAFVVLDSQCVVYLFAIAGAAVGAGIYWLIISNLGPKPTPNP